MTHVFIQWIKECGHKLKNGMKEFKISVEDFPEVIVDQSAFTKNFLPKIDAIKMIYSPLLAVIGVAQQLRGVGLSTRQ